MKLAHVVQFQTLRYTAVVAHTSIHYIDLFSQVHCTTGNENKRKTVYCRRWYGYVYKWTVCIYADMHKGLNLTVFRTAMGTEISSQEYRNGIKITKLKQFYTIGIQQISVHFIIYILWSFYRLSAHLLMPDNPDSDSTVLQHMQHKRHWLLANCQSNKCPNSNCCFHTTIP